MKVSDFAKGTLALAGAAVLLVACSDGATNPIASTRGAAATLASTKQRPPRACAGNALYFSDFTNSVIDSFNATGGTRACTVTAGGLSNPMGIWVQPVTGTYLDYLFAANSANGTAVAYKTPINNASVPEYQFNAGGAPSDVVQDMFGNVYVALFGTPTIEVF